MKSLADGIGQLIILCVNLRRINYDFSNNKLTFFIQPNHEIGSLVVRKVKQAISVTAF